MKKIPEWELEKKQIERTLSSTISPMQSIS